MAGYALAAEDTSPGRVQRLFEVCAAPPCSCDVRSFSSFEPTMTSADCCPVTPHVTARRAVPMSNWGWGFARFKLAQPTQLSAWFVLGTARPSRYSVAALSPHAGQISPGRCANCQCTSAAFTVRDWGQVLLAIAVGAPSNGRPYRDPWLQWSAQCSAQRPGQGGCGGGAGKLGPLQR